MTRTRGCAAASLAAFLAVATGACSSSSSPDGASGSCAAPDITASSLGDFVGGLKHGFAYQPLSLAQTNAVRGAAHALFAGDLPAARAQASAAGYGVVALQAGSDCFWAMQPTDAAPPGQALLLVATSWQRDLVIEAPHVPNDNRTDAEAAILFGNLHARALVVAGAQRCAVTTASGCHSNRECGPSGVAVESDPSHSVTNALHAIHLGLALGGSQSITLQLHTNVYSNLNGSVLVSNGTPYPIPGTAADALYAALQAPDIDVRSCNDPARPIAHGAFCGETNAQSLASNGATDSCTASGSRAGNASVHRFIHLEQDHQKVEAIDAWSARIANAIATAIPPVH